MPEPSRRGLRRGLRRAHEKLYGYRNDGRAIEIVAARVEVLGVPVEPEPASSRVPAPAGDAERTVPVYFDGPDRMPTAYLRSCRTAAGDTIIGPAVVHEATSTTVIDPGWQGESAYHAANFCSRMQQNVVAGADVRQSRSIRPMPCDPATLEVFNNRFAAIAEQMGITLRNTASSVNVKERLDFSCAVFTAARRPGRQRAAYSRSPRRDGRNGASDVGGQSRDLRPAMCTSPTIPIAAARICPT